MLGWPRNSMNMNNIFVIPSITAAMPYNATWVRICASCCSPQMIQNNEERRDCVLYSITLHPLVHPHRSAWLRLHWLNRLFLLSSTHWPSYCARGELNQER